MKKTQWVLFLYLITAFSFLQADWLVTSQDGLNIRLTLPLDTLKEEKIIFIKAFTESYTRNPIIMGDIKNLKKMDLKTFLQSAFEDEENDFTNKKEKTIFLSAKTLEGKTIGYASFDKGAETIYIRQLAVDPAFWKKGVGACLVFAIFKLWEKPSRLQLVTRRANTKALTFYQNLGFTYSNFAHQGLDPKLYCGMDRTLSDEEILSVLAKYLNADG
jgi:ribosomal protein S18 acetylase RimI-like enzyme